MAKKTGEKFVDKYGVETFQVYKADPEVLKIPPKGHVLYDPTAPTAFDPIRVEAIDRDGKMTTPVEVYTDPDTKTLWVLDGRGRTLDVREVNRRRAEDGRTPVLALVVPFTGDEKAAVARVREKNYHRRTPTSSGMALDLLALRNQGHSWDACAKALHIESADPEQWARKLLPLAFCIPEVQAAIDAGELPKGAASKFGGTAPDGSKALGKKAQADALAELRAGKEKPVKERTQKPLPAKARAAVRGALLSTPMLEKDNDVCLASAVFAFLAGDTSAFKRWPRIEGIVVEALMPKIKAPKEPKVKKERKKRAKAAEEQTAALQ